MKIKMTDIENVKILPDELKATGVSKKKEKAAIAKKISTPKKVPCTPKVTKVVAKVTKPVTVKAKSVAKVKKVITKRKKHGKKNRSKNL